MKNAFILLVVCLCAASLVSCKRGKTEGQNKNGLASLDAAKHGDGGFGGDKRQGASAAQVYFQKGEQLYDANREQEAIEAYKRAVSFDPEFAEAYFKLGLCYAILERKEEAREEYIKAVEAYKKRVEQKPDDADAHAGLGRAYMKLNQVERAAAAFHQVVKLKREDSDAYYELGMAYSKMAKYREAASYLQKAVDLDPDNFRASEALEEAKAGVTRRKEMMRVEEERMKKEKEEAANANSASSPKP